MYSLVVSSDAAAWTGTPFSLETKRFLEFTDSEVKKTLDNLDPAAVDRLLRLPCLFAYEQVCGKDPLFGVVRRVVPGDRDIRIEYEIVPVTPFLAQAQFMGLGTELAIEHFEFHHAHWAVKEVDLGRVLAKAGVTLPRADTWRPPVNVSTHHFDVGLSFPGEVRPYVRDVAQQLEDLLGSDRYFYDNNYESQLARPDLDLLLQDIYGNRSRLVVVFLSEAYETKPWCGGVEFRAIRQILMDRDQQRIMFVRMDAGDVKGTFRLDGAVDARHRTADEIARMIKQRVDVLHYDAHREVFAQHYSGLLQQPWNLPHQLRDPKANFVGRTEQIEQLIADAARGASISGLQGMGGIGKTELALVVASRLADKYPDASFRIELRGTGNPDDPDPGRRPLSPAQALAHVIQSIEPAARPPEDLRTLQENYLSLLHNRKAIILADNAASAEQVKPLLPPRGCLLLVTSRRSFLVGGLTPIRLDLLDESQANELLLRICPRIGGQAAAIIRQCGRLPLALRLAASGLAARPGLRVTAYLARLADARTRLAALGQYLDQTGEESDVTAVLQASYDLLKDDLQKPWATLSAFPGTFDAAEAAAVWGMDQAHAEETLGDLHRDSLIEYNDETLRWRLHDLARDFAFDCLEKLFDQYHKKGLWEEAAKLLQNGEPLGKRWYDLGRFRDLLRLIETLVPPGAPEGSRPAIKAALRCNLHWAAGTIHRKLGDLTRSEMCFLQAIEAMDSKDGFEAGRLWTARAYNPAYLGCYGEALEMVRHGRDLDRGNDVRTNEAQQRGWAGAFLTAMGQTDEALKELTESISISRGRPPNARHECHSLIRRGDLLLRTRHTEEALKDYQAALRICRDEHRDFEADALRGVGECYLEQSLHEESAKHAREGLTIAKEYRTTYVEAQIHILLGRLYEKQNDTEWATRHAREALGIAAKCEYRVEEAQAHLLLSRLASVRMDASGALREVSEAHRLVALTDHHWVRWELETTEAVVSGLAR